MVRALLELRMTQWKWVEVDSAEEAQKACDEWERKEKKTHPVRMDLNVAVQAKVVEVK